MKPTILALNGKMGVGKSEAIKTLAEYLKTNKSQNQVALVKFAAPLYDIQKLIYERIGKAIPRAANGEAKDRKLLQWLGTDWGRSIHGDTVWVDLWEREVQFRKKMGPTYGRVIIVCDDCRFENEAEKVRAVGGIVVKIVSDRTAERIALTGTTHASEAGISDKYVDFIIENNTTIEEYKERLIHLFNTMRLAE